MTNTLSCCYEVCNTQSDLQSMYVCFQIYFSPYIVKTII